MEKGSAMHRHPSAILIGSLQESPPRKFARRIVEIFRAQKTRPQDDSFEQCLNKGSLFIWAGVYPARNPDQASALMPWRERVARPRAAPS